MTRLCPSNTFQTPSSHAPSQWQFRVSQITLRVLSTVQQVNGPLRWRTACLTERLPLRCLSRWAWSGRIWLKAVITSIFQNELHLMTSWDILNARQCFLVQVLDGAVQQRLYGRKKERKVVFSEIGQDSGVFEPLTRSWTQAAAKIYIEFTPNHYAVTSVFVSLMALCALMHVVTALIGQPSVSINLHAFTNKLISIFCPLLMLLKNILFPISAGATSAQVNHPYALTLASVVTIL